MKTKLLGLIIIFPIAWWIWVGLSFAKSVFEGSYKEIVITGKFNYTTEKVIVKGKGKLRNDLYNTIECEGKDVEFM